MAQNYYSLKQAAEILGVPEDDLNQMVRRREIRAFADGGSWKFRDHDIDELKRSRDLVSDTDFFLDEPGSGSLDDVVLFDPDDSSSTTASDSDVARALSQEPQTKGGSGSDVRLVFGGDEGSSESGVRIVPDLADAPTDGPTHKGPTDSDIRLVDDMPAAVEAPTVDLGATLPDVPGKKEGPPIKLADVSRDDTLAATPPPRGAAQSSGGFEPIDDDEDVPLASDSSILPSAEGAAKAPTLSASTPTRDDFDFTLAEDSGIRLKPDGSGEIDLASLDLADKTPTLKQGAGDDSDSDFSLSLDDDIGLAQDIRPGAGDSGINLASPDDSGILLKSAADSGIKLSSSDTDTSDSEFEVSLESDDDIFDSDEMPGFKASDTAPRMAAVQESDSEDLSDSDFELAIDDEEVEVEDESGSEVVALEDEDEESESSEFDEELDEESPYGSPSGEPVVIVPQPAPWGVGWVVTLGFTTLVFSLVMMMMYEITRNAWSYNQPYPLSGTIINKIHEVGRSLGMP